MLAGESTALNDWGKLIIWPRYGGAYQLGSAAFQPLTGKIYSQFSIKVCP